MRTDGIHAKRRLVGQFGTRPSRERLLADAVIEGMLSRALDRQRQHVQLEGGISFLDLAHDQILDGDIVLCHQIDRVLFLVDIGRRLDRLGSFQDKRARGASEVDCEREDRAQLSRSQSGRHDGC